MKYTKSIPELEETTEINDNDLFLIATECYNQKFLAGSTAKSMIIKQLKEHIRSMVIQRINEMS